MRLNTPRQWPDTVRWWQQVGGNGQSPKHRVRDPGQENELSEQSITSPPVGVTDLSTAGDINSAVELWRARVDLMGQAIRVQEEAGAS